MKPEEVQLLVLVKLVIGRLLGGGLGLGHFACGSCGRHDGDVEIYCACQCVAAVKD